MTLVTDRTTPLSTAPQGRLPWKRMTHTALAHRQERPNRMPTSHLDRLTEHRVSISPSRSTTLLANFDVTPTKSVDVIVKVTQRGERCTRFRLLTLFSACQRHDPTHTTPHP